MLTDVPSMNELAFPRTSLALAARPFFDGVNKTISAGDAMYGGNQAHYFSVGASALSSILHAIGVTESNPSRILDFGCGAGRVTRWLHAAFPGAAIEGCDIRKTDVEFVTKTFGARTWISGSDVAKLDPPSTYDLIWVGSVFTHLSKEVSTRLLDKLVSWLNPSGVLIFTSHGRYAASIGPGSYGIDHQWRRVKEDFDRSQFGYADYSTTPGYGISLTTLSWWASLITSRANLRLVSMTERGWDNHQDVISVQLLSEQ
jgi:SAM-dependent methyltransferase